MSDIVRIKVVVETGFVGAVHEDVLEVDKGWRESSSLLNN